MFPMLPEELEYMIWKEYNNRHVLDIIKGQVTIWARPKLNTTNIYNLCIKDRGCYQENHADDGTTQNLNGTQLWHLVWKYRSLITGSQK